MATAPIGPLAWEPPYAAGAAQEMAKKTKKKVNDLSFLPLYLKMYLIHLDIPSVPILLLND